MTDSTPMSPVDEPADGQLERYEVVLDAPPGETADQLDARTAQVSALDLDRLPDRQRVRLLVDAEQLDRLRAAGLQVSVQRSVAIQPLDPTLVASEDDVTGWLTARLGPAPGAADDRTPAPTERPGTAPTDEER